MKTLTDNHTKQTFHAVKNLLHNFYCMVEKRGTFYCTEIWSQTFDEVKNNVLKTTPTHHICFSDLKPAKNAGKLVFSGVDSTLNVQCLLEKETKDNII